MKRTNIYLEEEQLRILKHIAVEEGLSFTALVRRALQQFTETYEKAASREASADPWARRMGQLLERIRERTRHFSSEEIEADVTAASEEMRQNRSDASRSR